MDSSVTVAEPGTVGSALQAILPKGTNEASVRALLAEQLDLDTAAGEPVPQLLEPWSIAPLFPPDLFAASAYLCKLAGIVSFFDPSPYADEGYDAPLHFQLTLEDREDIKKAAKDWSTTSGNFPALVRDCWQNLLHKWGEPLRPGPYKGQQAAPDWWKSAFILMLVADAACNRIMSVKETDRHNDPATEFRNWVLTNFLIAEAQHLAEKSDAPNGDKPDFRPPASLTLMADDTVACVLPKLRVAAVGATLRNASSNLALVPGRGEVRCKWFNLNPDSSPSEDDEALDILLIPEPAVIAGRDFQPHDNDHKSAETLHEDKRNWENFHLHQSWIDSAAKQDAFVDACTRLLTAAQKESRCVNAVVLPEYAVTYALFDRLCETLKATEPGLEFVIAGSSDNCDGDTGNHLLTRVWDDRTDASIHATRSRRKHHRWRMDRGQIETYGLSSVLNPAIRNWWEFTPLGQRELQFHRFRRNSVLSALICEELARSEPCHDILRSVAPNLIVALLMDGPQIKQRWPAQYASNLADDPGSSVLTFTSYGLIERGNRSGRRAPNHSVALWKDDAGNFKELAMPQGSGTRGILLSLWCAWVEDLTITGARSRRRAWRYSNHLPIYAPAAATAAKKTPPAAQTTGTPPDA